MNKNLHLATSAVIVLLAGSVYGLFPDRLLHCFFGVHDIDVPTKHIFKAVMGIYVGLALFWYWGVRKEKYWKAATLSNVLFMGGIALGRLFGLLMDGFSWNFAIALFLEFLYFLWGLHNLRQYG